MLTSAECQAKADAKFAQAKRESRNHKRLLATAEGWVVLAGIMGRLEASAILPDKRHQE
jgi:galactose-1-phosphate uridylyltransferase